jgi:very-short-patch-repair endonuclease
MVDYVRTGDKVPIICEKHGVFYQTAANHLTGSGCPRCSAFLSKSEKKIKDLLDDMEIEYIHGDRELISPFELDFVIPDYKIAIEFNGIFYHSEHNGNKDRKYHITKTEKCEKEGYQLIHIFENEYLQKYDILRFKLKSLFGKNKYRIFARKCEVRVIESKVKKQFNEKYHIQGDSQSCVNLGLYYKDRLVQVMTFSKRRKALGAKHVEGEYELSRMSSVKGFTIVGGASKLLKYFERNYNPDKLISYADRRWSKGDVYHRLGFDFIKNTQPNYWYFYNKRANKPLQHRYKFAKHTLKNKLEIFDPNLTEWENMKNNNYDRIWDSGSMLFEKHYT